MRLLVTSAWLVTIASVLASIALLLFLQRGDAEGSARLANAEIEALMERGETVEQRVAVMQRNWWDAFRLTHGVLAATDRRLLFVGVPPDAILPRGFEPVEFVERSVPFDRAMELHYGRLYLGTLAGVRVMSDSVHEGFAFSRSNRSRVDSVLAVVARRQGVLRAAAEAERRATQATAAASRKAIYHLVQRGEALDFIARRYGVSADSIVVWNSLPSTRINAGRRLLVKPERQ